MFENYKGTIVLKNGDQIKGTWRLLTAQEKVQAGYQAYDRVIAGYEEATNSLHMVEDSRIGYSKDIAEA